MRGARQKKCRGIRSAGVSCQLPARQSSSPPLLFGRDDADAEHALKLPYRVAVLLQNLHDHAVDRAADLVSTENQKGSFGLQLLQPQGPDATLQLLLPPLGDQPSRAL